MEVASEKSRSATLFRHGPIIIYTRLPAGGTYYPICMFLTNGECLIGISDAFFLPFFNGYPSSCPRAHCTPNKSVPTLRYTRRHGPIYTGPCPKALTECSPLDFRRSSISARDTQHKYNNKGPESPTVILTWHACKYKVHKLHQRYVLCDSGLCCCTSVAYSSAD